MKMRLSIIILALIITLSACGKGADNASEKAKQESASSVIVKKAEKDEKKDSAISSNNKTVTKDIAESSKPQESLNNIKPSTSDAKSENSPSGSTSTLSTQNSGSSYTANDDANYVTKEEPVDEEKDEPNYAQKHEPKPVYVDTWIPEEGHYETVVIKEAWTEEVPVYEQQYRMISNDTGEDWTDLTEDELGDAMAAQVEAGGKGSWSGKYIDVQVGTEKIYHEAETEKKWIVDVPGHYEKVLDHYE